MFTLHHTTLAHGRKPFWLGLLFTNKNEIRFPEFLPILHGVANFQNLPTSTLSLLLN